jgi:nucleoid-associated protein YgaU
LNDQLAAAQASTGNPLGQSTEAPSEAAVAPAADRGDAQPADSASQGGNGADSGETGSRSSREPQAPVGTTYRVQEGDTLQSIAQKFYGDERKYTLITKANHISASKVLVPGQKLIITSDPEQQ